MGVCQSSHLQPGFSFENFQSQKQQSKNNLGKVKFYQISSSNKNSTPYDTQHGPKKQEGQYTGVAYVQLSQQITKHLKEPMSYPQHIPRGHQQHDPFFFTKSNQIYHGQWLQGKPHGLGKSFHITKRTYFQGVFIQNIPSIYGLYINQNGTVYRGQISHGRANGQGIYQKNGITIKGVFKQNQPFGKCIEKGENYLYQGQFFNGKWTGQSKLTYNKGQCIYMGSFQNGFFHRYGVLITPEYKYQGEFKDGKRSGQGVLQIKDKRVYRGEFYQDLPDGKGIFQQNGKLIYKGQWRQGKAHGI